MSYEAQRDRRIIARHGKGLTYSLRRKNRFLPGLSLTLAAAASAGATSISVTTSGGLKSNSGRAVAGATFTLASVAGTYTVAADATATGNPLTITFTPALPVGGAANGAALTWVAPYAEHTYQAMNGAAQRTTDEKMVAAGERVRWLLYSSTVPAPAPGDDLGGLAIKSVDPIGSGSTATRYKCIVGAAS